MLKLEIENYFRTKKMLKENSLYLLNCLKTEKLLPDINDVKEDDEFFIEDILEGKEREGSYYFPKEIIIVYDLESSPEVKRYCAVPTKSILDNDEIAKFVRALKLLNDPDYKKYLELKKKFENIKEE